MPSSGSAGLVMTVAFMIAFGIVIIEILYSFIYTDKL